MTLSKALTCNVCGEDLTDVPCVHVERRTKIDIVFEKVVEHVDAEIKQCPTCEATVKGRFPADLHGPLQYGDGLKAFVINLLVCQMVALNRVQKLATSMLEVVIAEATLLKFVLRLHQALEDWEGQAIEQLLKAPALHVDETSLRVDRKTIGYTSIRPAISHSNFCIESEARKPSSRLISFHVTAAPSSMTVGHPILPIQTVGMACAVRTCCASSLLLWMRMAIAGQKT